MQTFDDTGKGRKELIRKFPIKEITKHKVAELNQQGAGVFFQPNPSTGRKESDVTAIKWVYVDMDEGTKDEMQKVIKNSPIIPHIITESKRSFHLFWKVDMTREEFGETIQRLIFFYDGDPAISSSNEVLRFPGFNHMKDPDNPYMIKKVFSDPSILTLAPLRASNFKEAYPTLPKPKKTAVRASEGFVEGRIKDIPILDVLHRLGVEVRGNFIWENGQETSASVNVESNYINRFSGKEGSGSTIDAVMVYGKKTLPEAYQYLKDMIGLTEDFDIEACVSVAEDVDEIDIISDNPYTWGTLMSNQQISPIEKHHLIIYGGESGSGKSEYTFFIARENAKKGHKVLFISLEMDTNNIFTRIARSYAGITKEMWGDKRLITDIQKIAYKRRKRELKSIENLLVAGMGKETPTKENISSVIHHFKPDLVIIDNFDLIEETNSMKTLEKQDTISKYFMDFTNKYKIPIILLHHYRKGDDTKNKARNMNAFRGSAKIIHNADTVVVGSRMEGDTEEEKASYVLTQVKDREFGIGGLSQTYFWKGEFYDNLPTHAMYKDAQSVFWSS